MSLALANKTRSSLKNFSGFAHSTRTVTKQNDVRDVNTDGRHFFVNRESDSESAASDGGFQRGEAATHSVQFIEHVRIYI